MTGRHDLPEEAWGLALAGLVLMGPRRLARLLSWWSPAEAWDHVLAGTATTVDPELVIPTGKVTPAEVARRWAADGARVDVASRWRRAAALGVEVHLHGRPGYPALLVDDVEPPPVLCARGPIDAAVAAPRVAIVGMRNATGYGSAVARRLGAELTEAGVVVVSGLALGIDGAAHLGALDALATGGAARPIGVVASGHDVVYPRRHRDLWRRVGEHGSLLSEVPPGGRPEAWRFPARNRVIAALADAVVVVESLESGGSMYTVEEAMRRGRVVMAVPGPIDSPASEGTNKLLAEGALVVRDTDDVLVAVGQPPRPSSGQAQLPGVGRRTATKADRAVLDHLVGAPKTIAQLATVLGLPLAEVATSVGRLVDDGHLVQRGQWLERRRGGR